ncbi:MAG: FecR domain-containing protein [Pseudomonadota bacterium]
MTNLVRSIAACALLLVACYSPTALALDTGDIVVESIKGEVRVTVNGAPATLRAGGVLELPATINTGRDGAIELRQGATTISVGPETQLEFPALEKRGGPIDRIVQPRGNAFYSIGKRAGRRLRVETPYLVGVIKGTQFNVAAQNDATTISLFEGLLEVHASDESSVVDLNAGEIAARKRGDKSISVIKMDNGKAAPTPLAPASPSGSNSGTPVPDTSGPVPVVSGDPVVADRGVISGTPAAVSSIVETVRGPADAAVDIDVRGNESGANVAAGISANAANLNVDVAANVGVSNGVDVGASAVVNLGSSAVDVGTAVSLNSGVDATVNLGGAVDAGPLTTAVDVGAAVDAVPGNVGANVNLGSNVDLGNVAAIDNDVGATITVGQNTDVAANVDVGANVAGVNAGVSAGTDLGAGTLNVGANLGGVDLGVNLDLGLDGNNGNDTSGTDPGNPGATNNTTTPGNPDFDSLLDSLLGRGKKKK